MLTFEEEPVKQQIARATNSDTAALRLYPFKNLEENLRAQVRKIKESPWIPRDVPVYGFVYQVEDGRLRQVL
jgi:carbonic anhydrase